MRVCPVCGRPGAVAEVRCPHDGASLVVLEGSPQARETDLLGQVVDGRYRVESVIGQRDGIVAGASHLRKNAVRCNAHGFDMSVNVVFVAAIETVFARKAPEQFWNPGNAG